MEATNTSEQRETDWDAHVRRVVDSLPPLSAGQREKLAVLLEPASAIRPGDGT